MPLRSYSILGLLCFALPLPLSVLVFRIHPVTPREVAFWQAWSRKNTPLNESIEHTGNKPWTWPVTSNLMRGMMDFRVTSALDHPSSTPRRRSDRRGLRRQIKKADSEKFPFWVLALPPIFRVVFLCRQPAEREWRTCLCGSNLIKRLQREESIQPGQLRVPSLSESKLTSKH